MKTFLLSLTMLKQTQVSNLPWCSPFFFLKSLQEGSSRVKSVPKGWNLQGEQAQFPTKRMGVEQKPPHRLPPRGSRGWGRVWQWWASLTGSVLCTLFWSRNRAAHHAPRLTPGKLHKSASECSGMTLQPPPSLQSWHLSPFKECTLSVSCRWILPFLYLLSYSA